MEDQELGFELRDNGFSIRVHSLELSNPDAEDEWDKNWIRSIVTIKAGGFDGNFNADFMTVDFRKFREDLIRIYKDLKGSGNFNSLEGQLEITMNGDGFGHFETNCIAMDKPGTGGKLEFDMDLDQTYIPELIKGIEKILEKFPVIGEQFNKRNK